MFFLENFPVFNIFTLIAEVYQKQHVFVIFDSQKGSIRHIDSLIDSQVMSHGNLTVRILFRTRRQATSLIVQGTFKLQFTFF